VHPTGQRQHVQATIQAADDAQTRRGVVAGMVIAPGPTDTSHFAGDYGLPLHMLLLLLLLLLSLMMRMMRLMMTDVAMTIPTTISSMYIDIVRVVAVHRHEVVVVIAVVVLLLL
jgi:hypothetical protein